MSSSSCKIKCIRDATDQKFQCKIYSCPESEANINNNEIIDNENDTDNNPKIPIEKIIIGLVVIFAIYFITKK
jgi:hypothetical protein